MLVDEATFSQYKPPRILYTKIPSPQLTKYFNGIEGTISEQGSLLSHLAIVARESKIPVIVNINLARQDFSLGDTIEMNGQTGQIKKII